MQKAWTVLRTIGETMLSSWEIYSIYSNTVAGTCCAGHCHAASHANGKQTKCEGGGTRTISIIGNTAASRVDHADIGGWRGGTLKGVNASHVQPLCVQPLNLPDRRGKYVHLTRWHQVIMWLGWWDRVHRSECYSAALQGAKPSQASCLLGTSCAHAGASHTRRGVPMVAMVASAGPRGHHPGECPLPGMLRPAMITAVPTQPLTLTALP